MNKPDLVIIYNDKFVVSNILDKLNKIENKKFKTTVYMDQVYLCQKKNILKFLNKLGLLYVLINTGRKIAKTKV
jgi:hypothetical protein